MGNEMQGRQESGSTGMDTDTGTRRPPETVRVSVPSSTVSETGSRGRSRPGRALAFAAACTVALTGCAIPAEPGSIASSARAARGANPDGTDPQDGVGATTARTENGAAGESGPAARRPARDVALGNAPLASGTHAVTAGTLTAGSPHAATTPSWRTQTRREIGNMSTRRLAQQLVVPNFGSVEAGSRGVAAGYGGVIVMRSSLAPGTKAAASAKAANKRYAAAMRASGRSWPAFISIDQEGGPVTRIDAPLTEFPAAMALGAATDPGLATQVGRASGAELTGLGFTVVMAPVADVTMPADRTIAVRSPSSDPARVSRVSQAYVAGYRRAGIVPVVKHFPGHGGVTADTHHSTAVLTSSRAALEKRDLRPFRDLVNAGAPAVMTSHVIATAFDRRRPASQSRPVTTDLLRRDMGFSGLVVTDSLGMNAASAGLARGEETVRAFEAGADVALMPPDPQAAVSAVEKAVRTGRLSRARLEQSAMRMVVALRTRGGTVRPAAPGANQVVARRVAAASITQVAGTCGSRLVGRAVAVSGGTPTDRDRFTRAARARGLRIGGTGATRVVLLGGGAYQVGTGKQSGAATGSGDVLVALDAPYGLTRGRAKARLATYGRTPVTFDGLLDVLTGRTTARGKLPVTVGHWRIGSGCG